MSETTIKERVWTDGDRREIRTGYLIETDYMVIRHIEQVRLVSEGVMQATTLTDAEYLELITYRQSERDCAADKSNPDAIEKPDFME
ncbi:MAG: hypothetical protein JRL30_29620 [Deltaproteobacteria bacterium]|nr:hypothetical protein [Deltaproteobacteria bacterium]